MHQTSEHSGCLLNAAFLTMLCLRILWTTGVKTSITTIERGRSRQCCNTQRWASAEDTFKCTQLFQFSTQAELTTAAHGLTLQKNSHRSGGGWLFSSRGAMAYTNKQTHKDEYFQIHLFIHPFRSGLSGEGVLWKYTRVKWGESIFVFSFKIKTTGLCIYNNY